MLDNAVDPWPDPIEEPKKPVPPEHPRFVLDCVGWHTRRRGNEGMGEVYRTIYGTLINFLQVNGLTTRTILPANTRVTDDVAIRMGDLNDEGLALFHSGYSKWLDRLDMGGDPTDTSILERALRKIRTGKANGRAD